MGKLKKLYTESERAKMNSMMHEMLIEDDRCYLEDSSKCFTNGSKYEAREYHRFFHGKQRKGNKQ